ncbi:MAG: DinB family protein [Longimicrobiales bacterium]
MTLVNELIEAWRYTRAGVIDEAANLPEAHFSERPASLGRSALDLVNHIIESGWLMAGELSRADGDFQRKPYPELIAEHMKPGDVASSKAQAIEILRRGHKEGEAILRAAGAAWLMQPIRQFNGEFASRLSWMHHGIAHEEYHRGQLALYARLFGLVPALTQQIKG